jgi:hypothetical protein
MTIRFHVVGNSAFYAIHIAWKAAIVVGSVIGVWLYALNPNIAIALIVSFPGSLTAIIALLAWRDNRKNHEATMGIMGDVKKNTDGIMSAKNTELATMAHVKDEQAVELSETAQKLAHVEGHEEGRQAGVASEINREPPETK